MVLEVGGRPWEMDGMPVALIRSMPLNSGLNRNDYCSLGLHY